MKSETPVNTSQKPRIAIGLVHSPVYDRLRKTVATNITNFDVHDIARAARTYGVDRYYLIHPMREQLMFVERLGDHWRTGYGAKYNPSRSKALEPIRTAESVKAAFLDWEACLQELQSPDLPEVELQAEGFLNSTGLRANLGIKKSLLATTSARKVEGVNSMDFASFRGKLFSQKASCFLLFGTGYGMTDELVQSTDFLLEPIRCQVETGFNHLSVRSAVSICLDRLLGA